MNSIKAIFDGKSFIPLQPIPVEEEYEVIITFIEHAKKTTDSKSADMRMSTKLPRSTIKGLLKGKVWMSDDTDKTS